MILIFNLMYICLIATTNMTVDINAYLNTMLFIKLLLIKPKTTKNILIPLHILSTRV